MSADDSSPPAAADESSKLDRGVVESLYQQHEAELRRFLLGVLRDQQHVGDVLHVTFEKLITQGHASREETRKAWLFRVAYHEAIALLRRRTTGDKIMRRLAWSMEIVEDAVETGLIQAESVATVREAIESLPPEQRQVVRMRIYDEKTFAEIASELDIPLGTALGRMRAAMEKMRTRLSD